MVRLTDRPDMTLDVYHGRKTTIQQHTFICTGNIAMCWEPDPSGREVLSLTEIPVHR